ncbi:MAG: hypothetical protein ABJK03_10370 [Paracoccaceae bacterium]
MFLVPLRHLQNTSLFYTKVSVLHRKSQDHGVIVPSHFYGMLKEENGISTFLSTWFFSGPRSIFSMSFCGLTRFFEGLAQSYVERDFEAVAAHYQLPGALYIGDDLIVWQDKISLVRVLKQHCACNYALGARSVDVSVIAQSLSKGAHSSAWILWRHLNKDDMCLFETSIRYFLRLNTEGKQLIQMIEVAERPQEYSDEAVPWPFRAVAGEPGKACMI